MSKKHNIFIITFILFINQIKSDLITDQIYLNITSSIPCVRRLNATHQIGCGNLDDSSYYGVLYLIKNSTDLTNLNLINLNEISKKLIVLTVPSMFTNVVDYYVNIDSKKKSSDSKFNGIVLLSNSDDESLKYSDDSKRPNDRFSYYNDQKTFSNNIDWNRVGSNYELESFKIPINLIYNSTESESIVDCYEKHNRNALLNGEPVSNKIFCGMQLGQRMDAAVNSRVCLRRNDIVHTLDVSETRYCDPLGGYNFYSFLNSPVNKKENSIVVLSSQLDSFTLFEYYTPGASKPISSIITFLSIAHLLSNNSAQEYANNLLFTLFSNEAFGYGGSSRFLYDLKSKNFPNFILSNGSTFRIDQNDLKFVVELSEFGNLASDDSTLWIHKDPITYNSSESIKNQVDLLINSLESYSNNTIKRVSTNEQPLPPSSIHSFLRQNVTIPSILIADHEIEYKNQFFRSIYDKRENLNLEWPSNITEEDAVNSALKFSNNIQIQTTIISKFLYEILTDNKTQLTNEVDIRLVNNLIYCYMFNATCQFFQSIQSSDMNSQYLSQLKSVSPKNVLSFYTTVTDQVTSGILITNSVLKYVTRERLADNLNSSECKLNSDSVKELIKSQQRRYTEAFFMKNGNFYDNRTICILSISFFNTSISPAFTDYLANQTTTDKLQNIDFYPSWTESVWKESNTMKIFLFSTKTIESVTLAIGICVAIISFIFTFLVNKYLSRWLLEGEEIESLNDNY